MGIRGSGFRSTVNNNVPTWGLAGNVGADAIKLLKTVSRRREGEAPAEREAGEVRGFAARQEPRSPFFKRTQWAWGRLFENVRRK